MQLAAGGRRLAAIFCAASEGGERERRRSRDQNAGEQRVVERNCALQKNGRRSAGCKRRSTNEALAVFKRERCREIRRDGGDAVEKQRDKTDDQFGRQYTTANFAPPLAVCTPSDRPKSNRAQVGIDGA